MKDRKSIFLLCGILIALISVAAFTIKGVGTSNRINAQEAQDPKAEIKHQRREERYGLKRYGDSRVTTVRLSEQKEGGLFNLVFIDYVEIDDLKNTAVRAAMQRADIAERRKYVCESDLVTRGEVVKATGVITEDDHFVYSIYTILVLDTFRTSAGVEVKAGDLIEMTAPGGIINLDKDHRIDFRYPALLALTVNTQYILNLKYDSVAGDFYFFQQHGVYEIEDDKLLRMDAKMDDVIAARTRAASVPNTLAQFKTEIEQITCGK